MIRKHSISETKQNPHFIGSWIMEEQDELCNKVVDHFNTNIGRQVSGVTKSGVVNRTIKDRTDISIPPKDFKENHHSVFYKYFGVLSACIQDYGKQWPFLKNSISSLDVRSFNIGKYDTGQHFSRMHTERSFYSMEREFAFMTYLSDNFEGGSTYFLHYDLHVIPKKGLTLIWPAMWTHAHKGEVITNGTKYILTGWLDLVAE